MDLKNKRLHTILKALYSKNYICKYQMIIKAGLHSPLELIVLEYDDKDSNIVHYTMKE